MGKKLPVREEESRESKVSCKPGEESVSRTFHLSGMMRVDCWILQKKVTGALNESSYRAWWEQRVEWLKSDDLEAVRS